MAKRGARDAVRPPDVSLTGLRPADERAWRGDAEPDGLDFVGLDVAEYAEGSKRFVECRITRSRFGDLGLRRSRIIASEIVEVEVTTLDVAESEWTDLRWSGGRVAALLAPGLNAVRVALDGVRSNYVNLRGASVSDLSLTDCRIGELDLGTATLARADLGGSEIDRLVLTGALLRAVDLSRAAVGEIEGIAELRGARISALQLSRLSPAFAEHLGVEVCDDAHPRG